MKKIETCVHILILYWCRKVLQVGGGAENVYGFDLEFNMHMYCEDNYVYI